MDLAVLWSALTIHAPTPAFSESMPSLLLVLVLVAGAAFVPFFWWNHRWCDIALVLSIMGYAAGVLFLRFGKTREPPH